MITYARGVGIAGYDVGHDGDVNDPQIVNAVDPQFRIDDGSGISGWTHFTRSRRMVNGGRIVTHKTGPIRIRPQREVLAAGERLSPKFQFY